MNLWASIGTLITDAKGMINEYTVTDGMTTAGVDNLRACLDKMQDVVNASTSGNANNQSVTVPADAQVTKDEPNPDPIISPFTTAG